MFLPDVVDRVELVEVLALDGDSRLTAIWDTDDARDALAMVAGLPAGEIKRCFIPGWQIRAHSDTEVLFEIAFCFRCDGAQLRGPAVPADQRRIHGFDSQSTQAQELLTRFRHTDQP